MGLDFALARAGFPKSDKVEKVEKLKKLKKKLGLGFASGLARGLGFGPRLCLGPRPWPSHRPMARAGFPKSEKVEKVEKV